MKGHSQPLLVLQLCWAKVHRNSLNITTIIALVRQSIWLNRNTWYWHWNLCSIVETTGSNSVRHCRRNMANKSQLFAIFQAFCARLLFFVHSFVAIWRCTDVLGNSKLWLLTLSHVVLIVETLITCCKRKGQEWKWWVVYSIIVHLPRSYTCIYHQSTWTNLTHT